MTANNDLIDAYRWRWNPGQARWFGYPAESWILDDIGIPDTSAGTAAEGHYIGDDDPAVERAQADMWLPDVFARLQLAHSRYSPRWPNLVWTWRNGGDWRSAVSRGNNPHPGDPNPPGAIQLNPACLKRVAEVQEWMRRGVVTSIDGQRLIRDIVEQCTTRGLPTG
jgi:hypothetical protein